MTLNSLIIGFSLLIILFILLFPPNVNRNENYLHSIGWTHYNELEHTTLDDVYRLNENTDTLICEITMYIKDYNFNYKDIYLHNERLDENYYIFESTYNEFNHVDIFLNYDFEDELTFYLPFNIANINEETDLQLFINFTDFEGKHVVWIFDIFSYSYYNQ